MPAHNRIMIRNNTHVVNFPDTGPGLMQARAFRKSHPEFKGRKIKSILQLRPSEVPMGEIMEVR